MPDDGRQVSGDLSDPFGQSNGIDPERKAALEKAEQFLAENADKLLHSVTAHHSTFTANELHSALMDRRDWQPPELVKDVRSSHLVREAITTGLLSDMNRVITYPGTVYDFGDDYKTRYTTIELQTMEQQILHAARSWSNQPGAGVRRDTVDLALSNYRAEREAVGKKYKLEGDIEDAIRKFVEPARYRFLHGNPGAGKSTVINMAVRALKQAGHSVLITAQPTQLIRTLERESGHKAMPLHQVLETLESIRDPALAPELGLQRGGMLIVDEAAMSGTREKFRIMQVAAKHNLSIGDIGGLTQMKAIAPGDPLRAIAEDPNTRIIRLEKVLRQRKEKDKEATLAMDEGNAKKALKNYDKRGRIKFTKDPVEQAAIAYTEWRVKPINDGKRGVMFTLDRKVNHKANQLARKHLKEAGYLSDGVTIQTHDGEREFSLQDRVLFRETITPDQSMSGGRITKGAVGTIEAIGPNHMTVLIDGEDSPVTIKVNEGIRLNHAYSLTLSQPEPPAWEEGHMMDSPQGGALDSTFPIITRELDHPQANVMITRHQRAMTLFVDKRVYKDLDALAKDASHFEPEVTALALANWRKRDANDTGPAPGGTRT
ncbi:MAG: AAA family ATPase [Alphaproteobacteria bacterium]|nr:AAA family ATPase [Alphaproteobacteria bacterium SS10]